MFNTLYQNLFKENKKESQRREKFSWDIESISSIGTFYLVDNYEQIISAAGFGMFSVFVLLLIIPMEFAMQLQMYTMSFALPQVYCELTLPKGLLITFNFIGAIPVGIVWMSLADIYGRRKILLIGMLAHCLIKILAVFATTFTCVFFYEFLGGLIICGPYAIYIGQVYDFHSGLYRKRILSTYATVVCLTNILIAIFALAIMQSRFKLEAGLFPLREWNFFTLLAVFPSVIVTAGAYLLPESPKYLIRASRKEDAINVVRYISRINWGLHISSDSLPEISQEQTTLPPNNFNLADMIEKVKMDFWSLTGQLKPLVLVMILQGFTMGSLNALKLWVPLLLIKRQKFCEKPTCPTEYYDSYYYTLIVSTSSVASFVIVLIFSLCPGHTARFMVPHFFVAAAASFLLYYIKDQLVPVLLLISVYLLLMNALNIVVITAVYESMPSNIKLSMAYQLALTTGRIFVVLETLLFSYLYSHKCLAPFLFLGCTALGGALTAFFISPRHQ